MLLPKTVILAIDSHGCYPIKDNKIYDAISVSNMNTLLSNDNTNSSIKNIYKINSVSPGVKNVSTKKIRDKTMEKIRLFIQNNSNSIERLAVNEEILDDVVLQLRDILMDCNNELISILQKDVIYKKNKNIEPETFANYLHHYDKSFAIEKNNLLEKNYVRFETNEKYKDKLLVMNSIEKGEIDLFIVIKELMNIDMDTFYLSDIIQLLGSLQVENIIILDFSCSDFKDLNSIKELSERDVRAIRRSLLR